MTNESFPWVFSSYPLHWYRPSRLTARGLRPLSKHNNIWLPEKNSLACNWFVDKQADTFADISQKLWQPSPFEVYFTYFFSFIIHSIHFSFNLLEVSFLLLQHYTFTVSVSE